MRAARAGLPARRRSHEGRLTPAIDVGAVDLAQHVAAAASRAAIARTIAALPHASVVVNLWSGLAFGLGTSPWDVPADADVQHGGGLMRGTAGVVAPRSSRCAVHTEHRRRVAR